jgi:hypothetical protein
MHSLKPYPAAPDLYLVPVVQHRPVHVVSPYARNMAGAEGADREVASGEPDLRVRRRDQPVIRLQEDLAAGVAAQGNRLVADADDVGLS